MKDATLEYLKARERVINMELERLQAELLKLIVHRKYLEAEQATDK